jgi:hypothetical protein
MKEITIPEYISLIGGLKKVFPNMVFDEPVVGLSFRFKGIDYEII